MKTKVSIKLFLSSVGFAILFFFVISCSKEVAKNIKTTQAINLIAPNGVKIASNFESLKNIASEVIAYKGISSSNFEITKVDFLNVKQGYAALVYYKTKDGIESNFGLANAPNIGYSATTLIKKQLNAEVVKTLSIPKYGVASANEGTTTTVSCAGSCGCKVEGTLYPDGRATYGCSCTDCTATISQIQ